MSQPKQTRSETAAAANRVSDRVLVTAFSLMSFGLVLAYALAELAT